jgi:hypothetical protein
VAGLALDGVEGAPASAVSGGCSVSGVSGGGLLPSPHATEPNAAKTAPIVKSTKNLRIESTSTVSSRAAG